MKKILIWPAILVFVLLMNVTQAAIAQCVTQEMMGTWINFDPNTQGITQVEIKFACNDTNTSREVDTIRVYGSCSPTDCDWGTESILTKFWDGRKAQYTYAEADYNFSHAHQKLLLFLDEYDYLIVFNQTEFNDDRQEFSSLSYFYKK